MFYLDTSALLPYYRQEPLSRTVVDFLTTVKTPVIITPLTRLEVASALSRWLRMSEISEGEAAAIEYDFEQNLHSGCYSLRPLGAWNFRKAREWLRKGETALRTLDALHLSCAAANRAELVTADQHMADAARLLGISHRLLEPS